MRRDILHREMKKCLGWRVKGRGFPSEASCSLPARRYGGFTVAAEICEDLWVPMPPSIGHALAGATVIVNLSASDETTGKRHLPEKSGQRTVCPTGLRLYLRQMQERANPSTDLVFGGHNMIAENGVILAESPRFNNQQDLHASWIFGDCGRERRRMTTFCRGL